jgi:hypothetical protein
MNRNDSNTVLTLLPNMKENERIKVVIGNRNEVILEPKRIKRTKKQTKTKIVLLTVINTSLILCQSVNRKLSRFRSSAND